MSNTLINKQSMFTREAILKVDAASESLADIKRELASVEEAQRTVEGYESVLDRLGNVVCPSDDINEEVFILLTDAKTSLVEADLKKQALIHRIEWIRSSLDDALKNLRG